MGVNDAPEMLCAILQQALFKQTGVIVDNVKFKDALTFWYAARRDYVPPA